MWNTAGSGGKADPGRSTGGIAPALVVLRPEKMRNRLAVFVVADAAHPAARVLPENCLSDLMLAAQADAVRPLFDASKRVMQFVQVRIALEGKDPFDFLGREHSAGKLIAPELDAVGPNKMIEYLGKNGLPHRLHVDHHRHPLGGTPGSAYCRTTGRASDGECRKAPGQSQVPLPARNPWHPTDVYTTE